MIVITERNGERMIINEKQIMLLMRICRRYSDVCEQMDWEDHLIECIKLNQEIEEQQSEELREIE